jgi:hypothetical protein
MYCNKNLRTVNLQKEIARDKTKSFYRNISRLSALFIFVQTEVANGLPSQILIGIMYRYMYSEKGGVITTRYYESMIYVCMILKTMSPFVVAITTMYTM